MEINAGVNSHHEYEQKLTLGVSLTSGGLLATSQGQNTPTKSPMETLMFLLL